MENYWKGKKILITGSSGFIGTHFLSELKELGSDVVGIRHTDCDLLSYEKTVDISKGYDILVNCAALDGNAQFKERFSAEIMDANTKITSNILNAAVKNKIADVVHLSTAEVYASTADSNSKEGDTLLFANEQRLNGYVISKLYGELMANIYGNQFGVNVYLPRPTNVYGPQDHFEDGKRRAIPNFIHKIAKNEPIEIWGDGKQVRQFVYVKDVVRTVLTMVEKKYTGVLNISTDEIVTIENLVTWIYKSFNKSKDIRFISTSSSSEASRIVDTEKMYKLIDFETTPLSEGLQKTIAWYLANF